jgi:hypothetical protein
MKKPIFYPDPQTWHCNAPLAVITKWLPNHYELVITLVEFDDGDTTVITKTFRRLTEAKRYLTSGAYL